MASKELIEKVARALYRSDYGNEFGFHQKDVAKAYSFNAEAAISTILAALQEPTKEMNEAAREWSYLKYAKPIGNEAANGCWKAMLNASLLGEQSE